MTMPLFVAHVLTTVYAAAGTLLALAVALHVLHARRARRSDGGDTTHG